MQELNTRLLTLGASGMRGVVGTGLTPGAASDFASAFATFAGRAPCWSAATRALRPPC